jgi:hypothetical protein
VGFGPGHSTIIYLASNPEATVYNFDLYPFLGESPELLYVEYVEKQPLFQPAALKYINKEFPGRLITVKGNSNSSVPEFAQKHPGFKCDFISIDGSHNPPQPFFDIYHFHALAHKDTILVLDDMQDLYGELERAMNGGVVALEECLLGERRVDARYAPWPVYEPGKRFCESRYLHTEKHVQDVYTGVFTGRCVAEASRMLVDVKSRIKAGWRPNALSSSYEPITSVRPHELFGFRIFPQLKQSNRHDLH